MKIYVVGIGPGQLSEITPRALEAIQHSTVITGYDKYIDLIRPVIGDKTVYTSGMKKESERCRAALDFALAGEIVCMVSSGDAGVYGMAGLMYEVCAEHPEVEIEVIPGITAACSGAAVAGAPLIHDFAVISLSDLLTPWELIEKRLLLAAEGDFVICIYNPSSKKRADYLKRAADYMLKHKSPSTPCACVENIGREGESCTYCTLGELGAQQVNMFTTVIVGNSTTKMINGKMVTPRGYRDI